MKLLLKKITVIIVTFLITSCQSLFVAKPYVSSVEQIFADKQFNKNAKQPETEEEIFSLPDDVKEKVKMIIKQHDTTHGRTTEILSMIFGNDSHNAIKYSNTATYTATQTLNNAQANCLSLSILAYSLAKVAEMSPIFQDVKIPEYWVSNSGRSWLNGHVNIKIPYSRLQNFVSGLELRGEDIIVDFEPSVKQRFDVESIERKRIVAMFYNNKAAEMLAANDEDSAYSYYKAAIQKDPSFAVSWSNLGVLYRNRGLLNLAELAYKHALELNPKSLNTMANMVILYRYTERDQEANRLQNKVDLARKSNPYYYVMLGTEALIQQNYSEAINLFDRSLRLDKKNHEAYYGLAKTYAALYDLDKATSYLHHAKRVALLTDDQKRYAQKLERLSTYAKVH